MKHYLIWTLPLFAIFLSATKENKVKLKSQGAQILQEGLIDCFKGSIKNADGELIHCEASAVFFDGNRFILASDKSVPSTTESPVFSLPLFSKFPEHITSSSVSYIHTAELKQVKKIEAFGKEPNGNLCFAVTDFEWIIEEDNSADAYNSILYWDKSNPQMIKYLEEVNNNGVRSSKGLRTSFLNALKSEKYPNGPPYYKIEGFCVLPDSTFLFGVREIGISYEHPEFTFIILSTKYREIGDQLTLDKEFKKVYEFDPGTTLILEPVGISGIDYNGNDGRIYISTSFENTMNQESEKFGAYVWSISLKEMRRNKAPRLLVNTSGNPLKFGHKVEGITFIDKETLFLVSDQDRTLEYLSASGAIKKRAPNQAVFTIVKLL